MSTQRPKKSKSPAPHQIGSGEVARIANLVKSLTNGVLMFDRERNIVIANPVARTWTGLEEGFTLADFMLLFEGEMAVDSKLQNIDLSDAIEKALDKGETVRIKEIALRDFVFELFITPVNSDAGEVSGGAIIMHDITQLKEVDEMKTEFISLVSHQLRTPLTAISWYAEIIESGSGGKLTDVQKKYLQEIAVGSRRMARLITDLLNVSRVEGGRLKISPEPTDLVPLLRELVDEVQPLAKKKGGSVKCDIPAIAPTVNVDKSLMRQVVHNLLTNAIKYSGVGKKKGEVVLSLLESVHEDKPSYVVSVQDNGIGIPLKWQDRVFQKFFRTENAMSADAEGTGLGLYIAKMVMDASGGDIWFESKEGEGTTFFVSIPKEGMKAKKGDRGLAI